MGNDYVNRSVRTVLLLFQSTFPVWGTTEYRDNILHVGEFQSTFPVWGTTLRFAAHSRWPIISIHVPRMGNDRRNP